MQITTDIAVFHDLNHIDLINFLRWKSIYDQADQHDITQDFYFRITKYKSLEKWNIQLGSFSAYVYGILSNCINDHFNNNPKFPPITQEPVYPTPELSQRVWDFRAWIIEHGGRQTASLLAQLSDRISGREIEEETRTTYYRYLNKYLDADSTQIGYLLSM